MISALVYYFKRTIPSPSWKISSNFNESNPHSTAIFEPTHPAHPIRKLWLIKQEAGDFKILIEPRSDTHAWQLKHAFIHANIGNHHNMRAFEIVSSDKGVLKRGIDTLHAACKDFEFVQNWLYHRLHIDPSQHYPIPRWAREGNFALQSSFDLHAHVIRTATFRAHSRSTQVQSITLSQLSNRKYQIIATARSVSTRNKLLSLFNTNHISAFMESVSARRMELSVETDNIAVLKTFIDIINSISQDFEEPKTKLYEYLRIEPSFEYRLPIWHQHGEFSSANTDVASSITRQMVFTATQANNPIKMVEFLQYNDGEYEIGITCTKLEKYNTFLSAARQSRFNLNILQSVPSLFLAFRHSSALAVHDYIHVLSECDDTLQWVAHSILHALEARRLQDAADANLEHEQPSSMTTVPSPGKNELEAQELGIDTSAVKESYLCALSQHLMTEPTLDPATPHIKFDNPQILHALSIKQENPFTRQSLSSEQLCPDEQLKGEIETFLKSKRKLSCS